MKKRWVLAVLTATCAFGACDSAAFANVRLTPVAAAACKQAHWTRLCEKYGHYRMFEGKRTFTLGPMTSAGLAHAAAGLKWQWVHSYFQNSGYNMCIGILYGSHSTGAPVRYTYCNGAPDQEWYVSTGGGTVDAYWVMQDWGTGQCLDFWGNSYSNGTAINQYPCDSGSDPAEQLGLTATNGQGGCTAPYAIHHNRSYFPEFAAVWGNSENNPSNLVEWQYCNSPGCPPTNAWFWNVPGAGSSNSC